MSPGPSIVLASASPRRAEILESLGLEFTVRHPRIPESRRPGERPEEYAERLAREKAAAVAAEETESLVLAGDTVVILDDEVLEKPDDEEAAVVMLLRLAGRAHRVATALALASPGGSLHSGVRSTEVRFRPFGEEEARSYAATGEPLDKAGAYGIQGRGAALVAGIDGDYSAVVGLSVPLLVELLRRAGRPYDFGPGRRHRDRIPEEAR